MKVKIMQKEDNAVFLKREISQLKKEIESLKLRLESAGERLELQNHIINHKTQVWTANLRVLEARAHLAFTVLDTYRSRIHGLDANSKEIVEYFDLVKGKAVM